MCHDVCRLTHTNMARHNYVMNEVSRLRENSRERLIIPFRNTQVNTRVSLEAESRGNVGKSLYCEMCLEKEQVMKGEEAEANLNYFISLWEITKTGSLLMSEIWSWGN